jgi:hypothetical protein
MGHDGVQQNHHAQEFKLTARRESNKNPGQPVRV